MYTESIVRFVKGNYDVRTMEMIISHLHRFVFHWSVEMEVARKQNGN